MKRLFIINDTTPNTISYWFLVGFLVALPFPSFYSELLLIGFGVHTLIHCRTADLRRLRNPDMWLLISIYLLGALALVYSPDRQEGANIMTRQLAIFLFPVLFSLSTLDLSRCKLSLFTWFAISCTITIIYLYADALLSIHQFRKPFSALFTLAYMNHNFSLPIGIHATYLSLYVAFAIVILFYLLSIEPVSWLKFFYAGCLLVLLAGLMQLSSRAVFIALLLVINTCFPLLLYPAWQRLKLSVIALLASAALLFIILGVDAFKERYISELKKDLAERSAMMEVDEPRMARWEAMLGLVKKSPVIGYGTGAEKEMLKATYFEKKLYTSYLNEFNTHNEYLSFLLKTGLIGLGLFLLLLFTGFRRAWRNRDLLFMSFMLFITVVCVSENLLDLNKGIFFYGFFFSLFLLEHRAREGGKGNF